MAGEQGYLYEKRCNSILLKEGLLGKPLNYYGGSDNTKPDGSFIKDGREYKIEYKLDLKADLGQASLSYESGRWVITGKNTPESLEIQELMRAAGAEKLINSQQGWGKRIPNKYKITNRKVNKKEATEDYRNFPNKYLDVSKGAVNSYYAAKDTYYIQIGGLGFYYMASNPANLDVPKFNPYIRIRFRLKAGGSGLGGIDYYNYRFSVALQAVTKPNMSNADITKDVSFLKTEKE